MFSGFKTELDTSKEPAKYETLKRRCSIEMDRNNPDLVTVNEMMGQTFKDRRMEMSMFKSDNVFPMIFSTLINWPSLCKGEVVSVIFHKWKSELPC